MSLQSLCLCYMFVVLRIFSFTTTLFRGLIPWSVYSSRQLEYKSVLYYNDNGCMVAYTHLLSMLVLFVRNNATSSQMLARVLVVISLPHLATTSTSTASHGSARSDPGSSYLRGLPAIQNTVGV